MATTWRIVRTSEGWALWHERGGLRTQRGAAPLDGIRELRARAVDHAVLGDQLIEGERAWLFQGIDLRISA